MTRPGIRAELHSAVAQKWHCGCHGRGTCKHCLPIVAACAETFARRLRETAPHDDDAIRALMAELEGK